MCVYHLIFIIAHPNIYYTSFFVYLCFCHLIEGVLKEDVIFRGGEFVPSAQIAKNLSLTGSVDLPLTSSTHSPELNNVDVEMCQKILSVPSQCSSESMLDNTSTLVSASSQQNLTSYSSVLHYETSFQNRKHAMIKNIKFKVPEQYTNSFKTLPINSNIGNSNSYSISADSEMAQTYPLTNKSVIVNNSNLANCSDLHWRRRTSQNLVLKN